MIDRRLVTKRNKRSKRYSRLLHADLARDVYGSKTSFVSKRDIHLQASRDFRMRGE